MDLIYRYVCSIVTGSFDFTTISLSCFTKVYKCLAT
jgi:hypothetical protein